VTTAHQALVQSEWDHHCSPSDHTTTQTITSSRGLIYWFLPQENRNELNNRRHCFKSKQILLPPKNWQKLYFLIEKLFTKNSPKNRTNFDKTSPNNRNPQQQKISRNATKKTAHLCEKTAQLATLDRAHLKRLVNCGSAAFTGPAMLSWDAGFPNWYQGRTQGGDFGVKTSPLSLIFYKNFITFARRWIVFAYILLVNMST